MARVATDLPPEIESAVVSDADVRVMLSDALSAALGVVTEA